jgi:hypothetical protein
MPSSGFPGPIFIATAAALVGGGVWFANPANQKLIHQKFDKLGDKIHDLELKLKTGKVGTNIKALLHKFDRDGSGSFSPDELLEVDDAIQQSFWTPAHIAGVVALNVLVLAIVSSAAFFFWRRSRVPPNTIGTLEITIVKGQDLLNVDSGIKGDLSDPYVEVHVGALKFSTSKVANNLNPEWKDATHVFKDVDLKDKKKSTLSLFVLDAKSFGETMSGSATKSIGHAEVDIASTFGANYGRKIQKCVPLMIDHKADKDHPEDTHEQHGYLTISGTFMPKSAPVKAKATIPVATPPKKK